MNTLGSIESLDPALDALLDTNADIEILSSNHDWTEGPVWVKEGGYLLFSDIPRNQILKWELGNTVSVFMEPSGYTGSEPFTGRQPGSNGLTLDAEGRLALCCHGDRLLKRIEKDGSETVLATHYDGKRLNSPNDLIYHSNGDLYFTDPPYGLPGGYENPEREMDWCGVFRLSQDGTVTLITKDIHAPNGIAFSPDERTLYVSQSNREAANWTALDLTADDIASSATIFYDSTDLVGKMKGVPDGMSVDVQGNLWVTGPGGVMIISPERKLLGRIVTGQASSNCAFGEDGSTLFITLDDDVVRVKTKTTGLVV
jgi:gluconolactonase